MNLQTLIPILENTLTRTTTSTKNNTNILTYKSDVDFTTTYTINTTETTLENCKQICINHNNTGTIQIYINHTNRKTLRKLTLTDITNLTIT